MTGVLSLILSLFPVPHNKHSLRSLSRSTTECTRPAYTFSSFISCLMPPSHANTSAKDAALYGAPRPKKSRKEISSSTTLSFTSQLSSLISGSNNPSGASRSSRTSSRNKEDIFKTHNKGAKKRALKDLEDDDGGREALAQKHSTTSDALDSAAWHRSKRKMEEKARLYAAMKRGDVDDQDGKFAVDFDRKWAEKEDAKHSDQSESSDDGHGSDDEEEDGDMVEWEDEFGRTRKTSKKEMLREQRQQHFAHQLETRARPAMPDKVIYGDTVQTAAFNPDDDRLQQMEELAKKRDKSATPPPDTHFDATKEIRSKGVGFMQFSLDEDERKKQMENLEKDRLRTESVRRQREKRLADRKAEVERRKTEIQQRRGKKEADEFLSTLGAQLAATKGDEDAES